MKTIVGELDGEELRLTTLDPSKRTSIQVKSIEDAKQQEKELLNLFFGNKTEGRKNFIQTKLL